MRTFIKALVLVSVATVFALPLSAQTQTEDSLWLELVENSQTSCDVMALGEELKTQIKEQMPNLADSTMQEIDDTLESICGKFDKEIALPEFKKDFTVAEMMEINAFFRTPAGQKFKENQAKLALDLSRQISDIAQSLNEKIVAILQREKKN